MEELFSMAHDFRCNGPSPPLTENHVLWKPLPSRRVLKTLRGSSKGKARRGQASGGLGPLQMASELASEDAGP